MGKRFIFMSGAANHEIGAYARAENITLMHKPFSLEDIRQAVYKTIDQVTV